MSVADPDIEAFVAKVRELSAERDQLLTDVENLKAELKALKERLDKVTAALG